MSSGNRKGCPYGAKENLRKTYPPNQLRIKNYELSQEELRTAKYLQSVCAELGLSVRLEDFEVDMATIHEATLTVDGEEIPCKGYLCAGCGEVEAPLYYLTEGRSIKFK